MSKSKMRIVAMTNEGQLPMMKNMLNSALKVGFDMSKFHCYILKSDKESAKYNTKEFKNITTRKLEVILANMNYDSEILWVDNDIVFFENCIEDMKKHQGSFIMQDDEWGYCTGFFFARSSIFSKSLISQCISWLQDHSRETFNDQHAFNALCKVNILLRFVKLPQELYPNGKVYFDMGYKKEAKMVHNNYLDTTAQKVERFKNNNLWDESDTGFNLVNKYFI